MWLGMGYCYSLLNVPVRVQWTRLYLLTIVVCFVQRLKRISSLEMNN